MVLMVVLLADCAGAAAGLAAAAASVCWEGFWWGLKVGGKTVHAEVDCSGFAV